MDVLHFPIQGFKNFRVEEVDVIHGYMAVVDGMFHIRRCHYAYEANEAGLMKEERKFYDSIFSFELRLLGGMTTIYRNDSECYEIQIQFDGLDMIALEFEDELTADKWYQKIFKLLYPDRIAALRAFMAVETPHS